MRRAPWQVGLDRGRGRTAARFVGKAKVAVPRLEGILKLAAALGTSLTSTAIRYAALDALPCAVIKWDWGGYAWKRLSAATLRMRLGRTVESREGLAPGSPTARALRREQPPECGYFQAGTIAAAWFPRVRPGELRDALLVEQAIPLGRCGVLTFFGPGGGRYASA